MFSGSRLVSSTVAGWEAGTRAARSDSATPRPASTSTSVSSTASAVAGPRRLWSSCEPPVPSVNTVNRSKLRGSRGRNPAVTSS